MNKEEEKLDLERLEKLCIDSVAEAVSVFKMYKSSMNDGKTTNGERGTMRNQIMYLSKIYCHAIKLIEIKTDKYNLKFEYFDKMIAPYLEGNEEMNSFLTFFGYSWA